MVSVIRRVVLLGLATAVIAQPGYAQQDREGCADHPLFSRMNGYFIKSCKNEDFNSYKFNDSKGGRNIVEEGRYTLLEYHVEKGVNPASGLAVIRNFGNAVKAIGGEVIYEGRYSSTMKAMVGGREVWIDVQPGPTGYRLNIIEKEEMEQQVVADAAALLGNLDRAGHVVLHGVLFDTDKDVIKPESEPALTEIAKLLHDNPEMKAFVVGHTDMTGDLEHNLDLSLRRAAAVVEALVSTHGIAAERLEPRGIGPLAPVASNDTEEGRSLNRRVELVKR